MLTEYNSQKAKALLDTLTITGHEMPVEELVKKAKMDFFTAPSVIGELLSEGKIAYRVSDGVQLFRLNNNKK